MPENRHFRSTQQLSESRPREGTGTFRIVMGSVPGQEDSGQENGTNVIERAGDRLHLFVSFADLYSHPEFDQQSPQFAKKRWN